MVPTLICGKSRSNLAYLLEALVVDPWVAWLLVRYAARERLFVRERLQSAE